jgi:hypothetical protein
VENAEARVQAAVSRATYAIELAVLESDLYEYTVFDDEGSDVSFAKLKDFADFALTV